MSVPELGTPGNQVLSIPSSHKTDEDSRDQNGTKASKHPESEKGGRINPNDNSGGTRRKEKRG